MASYPRGQSLYIAAVESLGFNIFYVLLVWRTVDWLSLPHKNWLIVWVDVAISPVIVVYKN